MHTPSAAAVRTGGLLSSIWVGRASATDLLNMYTVVPTQLCDRLINCCAEVAREFFFA